MSDPFIARSHLGPVLFFVYTQDLALALTNIEFSFYADDFKLCSTVASLEDWSQLQHSINQVASWGARNGLKLNAGKSQVISFSRAYNVVLYDYLLDGTNLLRVDIVKNLGVFLDSKLNFSTHIDRTISKCHSMLGLIKWFARECGDPSEH